MRWISGSRTLFHFTLAYVASMAVVMTGCGEHSWPELTGQELSQSVRSLFDTSLSAEDIIAQSGASASCISGGNVAGSNPVEVEATGFIMSDLCKMMDIDEGGGSRDPGSILDEPEWSPFPTPSCSVSHDKWVRGSGETVVIEFSLSTLEHPYFQGPYITIDGSASPGTFLRAAQGDKVLYAIELGNNLPSGAFGVEVSLSSLTGEMEADSLVCGFEVDAASAATPVPAEPSPTQGSNSSPVPTEAPATQAPTQAPVTEAPATQAPTEAPATQAPTEAPATQAPAEPTAAPTEAPAEPSAAPTEAPAEPTAAPTEVPAEPSAAPTEVYGPPAPTEVPAEPSAAPTEAPAEPSAAPTEAPAEPSEAPTEAPAEPSEAPTEAPAEPSEAPTEAPAEPTQPPVYGPFPTEAPAQPTEAPAQPTEAPVEPTEAPAQPTEAPVEPTEAPVEPTEAPAEPTVAPTVAPTLPPAPIPTPEPTVVPPGPSVGFCSDVFGLGENGGVYYAELKNGRLVAVLEFPEFSRMGGKGVSLSLENGSNVRMQEVKSNALGNDSRQYFIELEPGESIDATLVVKYSYKDGNGKNLKWIDGQCKIVFQGSLPDDEDHRGGSCKR